MALTGANISGGMYGAALEFNAAARHGTAGYFQGLASRHLDRALTANPAAVGRAQWYGDLDYARSGIDAADDMARSADDVARTSKSVPLKLGGVLTVGAIAYEVHQGKDPTQAITTGGGAFLASVGTGFIVGSAIPVPGVGTAVGVLVGAGVGIIASGAIDSLFDNGLDAGAAARAGRDALGDTAGAIGGAAGGAVDTVTGWFD